MLIILIFALLLTSVGLLIRARSQVRQTRVRVAVRARSRQG